MLPIGGHAALAEADAHQQPLAACDKFDAIIHGNLSGSQSLLHLVDGMFVLHDVLESLQHPPLHVLFLLLDVLLEVTQQLLLVLAERRQGPPVYEQHPKLVLPMQEVQLLLTLQAEWLCPDTALLHTQIQPLPGTAVAVRCQLSQRMQDILRVAPPSKAVFVAHAQTRISHIPRIGIWPY